MNSRQTPKSNPYDELLGYCHRGDLAALDNWLKKHSLADFEPDPFSSALGDAVRAGHLALVQVLLAHGADPNAMPGGYQLPLWEACESGRPDIAEALLAAGARIDAEAKGPLASRTVLTEMLDRGDTKSALWLIEHGANLELPADRPPLAVAAENNQLKLVRALLARGASVNARDRDEWTALAFAVRYAGPQTIHALLKAGAGLESCAANKWSALHIAAMWGRHEAIEILLRRDADIEVVDNQGWTPLMHAAHAGEAEAVKLLLAWGADVLKRNKDGLSARDLSIGQAYDALRPGLYQ